MAPSADIVASAMGMIFDAMGTEATFLPVSGEADISCKVFVMRGVQINPDGGSSFTREPSTTIASPVGTIGAAPVRGDLFSVGSAVYEVVRTIANDGNRADSVVKELENPAVGVASFEYDFDVDGGAVGDLPLGLEDLPKGALILGGMIHVKTSLASEGAATLSLRVNTAEDVLPATAKASLSAGTRLNTVCDMSAANSIVTEEDAQVIATIGAAALTAGRLAVFLFYAQSFSA